MSKLLSELRTTLKMVDSPVDHTPSTGEIVRPAVRSLKSEMASCRGAAATTVAVSADCVALAAGVITDHPVSTARTTAASSRLAEWFLNALDMVFGINIVFCQMVQSRQKELNL